MGRIMYVSLACVLLVVVHARCSNSEVKVEPVTPAYGLSEGPFWDNDTQNLWFVDINNKCIRKLNPVTGVVTSAYLKGRVGVVVPIKDTNDQLVAGVERDLIKVTWEDKVEKTSSALAELKTEVLTSVDLTHDDPNTRINDGKVDSAGRFWLGTMGDVKGQSPPNLGTLYRIDNKLKPKVEITPVSISNGLAWNIQDDTFYYIDSPTRQIAAYDYEPHNGTISNRRIVFNLDTYNLPGVPDGMTIDTDGNLWIALFGGHHIINVNPKTGELLRKIRLPAENVTSAAFGGPLLDILYVTTSGYGLTEEQRKETPLAGCVFAIKGLGVKGFIANKFLLNQTSN